MSRGAGAARLRIEPADTPDDTLRAQIAAPLLVFNSALAGPSGHRPLVLVLRAEEGHVAGGMWGATAHGWLYTQMLVVPEAARGQGLGAKLMQQAEALARERGCIGAWVDTQFGARGFYERLGYAAFGELRDYPPGFSRTFLFKRLDTVA
jgi:GNAT superfamily N-acetyltransferase